jgi:hypothetical protein
MERTIEVGIKAMRSHKSKKTLDPKFDDEAAIRTLCQQMIGG